MPIKCVDLFCGVGGLTKGFEQSGIKVVAGYDNDQSCRIPYNANNEAEFIYQDITRLDPEDVVKRFKGNSMNVVAGGPPCQPFSNFTKRNGRKKDDERIRLIDDFRRVVTHVEPSIVFMENVPQVKKTKIFKQLMSSLEKIGYRLSCKVVKSEEYGVPQKRRRLLLLGSKEGDIEIPEGKYKDKNMQVSVWNAIGDLEPIRSGEKSSKDLAHVAPDHGKMTLKRLRATPEGGSWTDWDEELWLDCHKKESGKKYSHVYSRMKRDGLAPTITGHFGNFGSGTFGHPYLDRAITPREAANLQSFPKEYTFINKDNKRNYTVSNLRRHIGNAVPVRLAKEMGVAIINHLDSTIEGTR